MGVYRYIWLVAICAAAASGAVLGARLVPWESLVALGVLAAIMGPLAAAGIYAQRHRATGPPWRYVVSAVGISALGAVAVSGLIAEFGAAALAGCAVLVLASPAVLRRLLTHAPRSARSPAKPAASSAPATQPPTVQQAPAHRPPPSCRALSDAELCWRWRTSFCAIQRTVSPGERLRLAETRAALLDELARRDPEGVSRWLDSGARAGSDPARYLSGAHHGQLPRRQDQSD